jgi:DNA primase
LGGRLLDQGEPKYLNSPETPIYHKGAMLYNLHAAKQAIRREEQVILVEGYFDVLRLVLAGIDHVVAPLGTALTADQAALLRRFAPLALLLYDSDPAGLKATFRAADECLRHKLRVKVATLPEGEDPDTLVRMGGAAALAPILHDAVDVIDRKIQILERKGWFEGLEHRRDALDGLLKTVRVTADPIARDLYLQRVSERTGVSRAVLEQELAARPAPPPAPAEPPGRAAGAGTRPSPSERHRQNPGLRFEEQVLESMLIAPEWRGRAAADLSPTHFTVPTFRRIFEALVALPGNAPVSAAAEGLDPRAQEAWQRLAESADSQHAAGLNFDAVYAGAVDELRRRAQPLPPVSDIPARRAGLNALPPEARQRFAFRKEAEKARRRSTERPGPDHSQHS